MFFVHLEHIPVRRHLAVYSTRQQQTYFTTTNVWKANNNFWTNTHTHTHARTKSAKSAKQNTEWKTWLAYLILRSQLWKELLLLPELEAEDPLVQLLNSQVANACDVGQGVAKLGESWFVQNKQRAKQATEK